MNNHRLILTRWIAVAVMVGAAFISVRLFRLPLPELPLYLLGLFIFAYNAVLAKMAQKIDSSERLLMGQIGLDWFSMAVFLHFTGGITSPALVFFFLHVIVVTVLLPGQSPYLYVGIVLVVVLSLAFVEGHGILPHYTVIPNFPRSLHREPYYVVSQVIFLGAGLFATAYLTAMIMKSLRKREQQLTTMYRSLEQAEHQRTHFVHILTHELRAPVTGAQSLLRIMLLNLAGELTVQQRDIIERLSRRMESLLVLINDLLSLAETRAADFQRPLEPVHLLPLIQNVADRFTPQANEKELSLVLSLPTQPVQVPATPEGITRILDNLVNNAIKYTPEGGRICIQLENCQGRVHLTVSDTGIGIPEDAIAYIGQEFYRAPNARISGIPGTGLGLATVRQMVTAFHGTLEIQSRAGEGSQFTIVLPLYSSPTPVSTQSH